MDVYNIIGMFLVCIMHIHVHFMNYLFKYSSVYCMIQKRDYNCQDYSEEHFIEPGVMSCGPHSTAVSWGVCRPV